ncbi:hypothetical protein Fmac_028882 [Flemingia macrophylla]|uniref:GRF-type domain-containing protein n=1 Tax=Flemingia macrophylla TaxID=520843 RepID=A0ABD1L935_9FABA
MSSAITSSMPSYGSRSAFSSCHCREVAVLRTAMTSRNAGNKFWGCPNYKSGDDDIIGCNYFEWVLNEVDGKDLVISRMKRKIQSIQSELKSTKLCMKMLIILMIEIVAMLVVAVADFFAHNVDDFVVLHLVEIEVDVAELVELFRPNNSDSSKDHSTSVDFALLTLLRLKIGFV